MPLVQNGSPLHQQRVMAGLEPYVPNAQKPWDYKRAAHLLRRCLFGPTDAEIRRAVNEGLDATIKGLFTTFSPALTDISQWAGQEPQIRAADSNQQQEFQTALFTKREQLIRWWSKIMVNSPTSLQERIALMWHNHFVSEIDVVNFAEFMYVQNQLFRTKGLGNFKQLVKDVTKDPAMLLYLDGIKNQKRGNRSQINENYARELMELFTCGVNDWQNNPNYTETDVREAARALSGWTISPSTKTDPAQRQLYIGLTGTFVQALWDNGQKELMGRKGNWNADDVVDIIFEERATQTARFVCEKIYREFVYDIPDRVLIGAMAEEFKKNWEIKPIVELLLRSAHFFDDLNIGAMYKSPADYMNGSVRTLGITDVPDFNFTQSTRLSRDLSGRMAAQGQTLFNPPNVKGWPQGRTWVSTSTLPLRQKFMLDMIDGKISVRVNNVLVPYYKFDPMAFAKSFPSPNDARTLCRNMVQLLLNTEPSEKEFNTLLDTMLDGAKEYEWDIDNSAFRAAERLKKFLKAVFQLAKYQLY